MPGERIFWPHELTLVSGFAFVAYLCLRLAQDFFSLQAELHGKRPEVDALLETQRQVFHRRRWLVLMPALLAGFAVSLRFIAAEGFQPFHSSVFEFFWLVWLYLGFFLLLHASVLSGRYSEVVKQLSEAGSGGLIDRPALAAISRFYFRIALLNSVFFAVGVFTVFSLHMIYTYSGNLWPGYACLRQLPDWMIHRRVDLLRENGEMMVEVFLVVLFYASACFASFVYFFVPQWGLHAMLLERKRRVLEAILGKLAVAENDLIAEPREEALRRFSELNGYREAVEKLPEWPFVGEGFPQPSLLIIIPGFLVLMKELFLETLINLIFK